MWSDWGSSLTKLGNTDLGSRQLQTTVYGYTCVYMNPYFGY